MHKIAAIGATLGGLLLRQSYRGAPKPSEANAFELLALAGQHTRRSSPFTYRLSQLLLPASRRPFFHALYAYFRAVDNQVDAPWAGADRNFAFLQRQAWLVERLYDQTTAQLTLENEAEALLALLIADDARQGARLKRSLLGMLASIRYDAVRSGGLPLQTELDHYIKLEASSYLRMMLAFCCPSAAVDDLPTPYEGIAGKWIHLLRDFRIDVARGVINLSRQDAARHGIRPEQLGKEPDALAGWVAEKVVQAQRDFARGKRELQRNPCLRYKLVVGVLCVKYEAYLALICRDRFRLRATYPHPPITALVASALSQLFSILVGHYIRRRHCCRTPAAA
jgi:phytoene/squalene synthetase